MDLNEISIFIKVVQAGSFSLAAKQLLMPISTVSSKVSSLEKRLGVTLIQRTTRKLHVTNAGQAYFKRCIEGLSAIQAGETEIASTQLEPQGLLRVTAPVELGSTALPSLVSDFTNLYPKVRVEMILTDRTVDLLGEGVDLAIRAGDLEDSSLIAKKIGSAYFGIYASPKYLKAKGTPLHPKELKPHSCIQFTPIGVDEWVLVNGKTSFTAQVSGKVIANDLNMVKLLLLKGDGIALLPASSCQGDVSTGKLVRILPDWKTGTAPVHFVYPAQRFVTPKLSAFIAFSTDLLKQSFES